MPLDPEIAEALRANSRDAAAAFLEDFDHIHALLAGNVYGREHARRLSVILRRLLIESELLAIASPRVGRIRVAAPDLSNVYVETALRNPVSFSVLIFAPGVLHPLYSMAGNAPHSMKIDEGTFSVAAFRDQRVLYLAGEWVSRRDLIRYVANEKSGVHSGQEDKLAHKSTISKLEMMMSVTTSSSNGRIEVTLVDAPTDAPISTYQKNATNPVLMYMYLTAAALVRSPDIERLAETIRQELA